MIDFDDMLYEGLCDPHVQHVVDNMCRECNWLLVDEAQDLNAVQRAWVWRIMHARSDREVGGDGCVLRPDRPPMVPMRCLSVGDPLQAIYGFRGAEFDALDRLQAQLGAPAEPMALTTSYRCARSHVVEANKIIEETNRLLQESGSLKSYAHMECPPHAIQGEFATNRDLREVIAKYGYGHGQGLEVGLGPGQRRKQGGRNGRGMGRGAASSSFTSASLYASSSSSSSSSSFPSTSSDSVAFLCRRNHALRMLVRLFTARGIRCSVLGDYDPKKNNNNNNKWKDQYSKDPGEKVCRP